MTTTDVQVQRLRAGVWEHVRTVSIANGSAAVELTPGVTTTTYRFRHASTGQTTEPFTVQVAKVTATLTGPRRISRGASTSIGFVYLLSGRPGAGTAHLQQRASDGTWMNVQDIQITNGAGSVVVRPQSTTVYRAVLTDSGIASNTVTVDVRRN